MCVEREREKTREVRCRKRRGWVRSGRVSIGVFERRTGHACRGALTLELVVEVCAQRLVGACGRVKADHER